MKPQKPQQSKPQQVKQIEPKKDFLFSKINYYIIIAGLIIIGLGFALMVGGGSDDPAVFNDAIFNTQRLTIAPLLLIIGYALPIVAIFYKNPEKKSSE
jgi:hypothetical protein